MAQAVAETFITIRAVIAVDVLLAWRRQFVNAPGIRCPIEVEILPESCRTQVEHSSPKLTYGIEATLVIACLRARLQHIVSVKCRQPFRPVYRHYFRIEPGRISEARQCHQRSCLFAVPV